MANGYEFFDDIEIEESKYDIIAHITTHEEIGAGGHKWMCYAYNYSLIEWDGYEDYIPQELQIMRWLLYVASEMPNDNVSRKVAEKAIKYYIP